MRIHSLSLGLSQAYLIESTSGLILVDTGLPGYAGKILKLLQTLKRDDLRLIYITHAHLDHYGSAADLRRSTGAPIAVHKADAGSLTQGKSPLGSARGIGRIVKWMLPMIHVFIKLENTTPDMLLEDGQKLRILDEELVVLHTPGHTPGSSCLMVNGEIIFTGDLVSTIGKPHIQRYFAFDWRELSQSLSYLKSQKPHIIYPGHGSTPLSGKVLKNCGETSKYNASLSI